LLEPVLTFLPYLYQMFLVTVAEEQLALEWEATTLAIEKSTFLEVAVEEGKELNTTAQMRVLLSPMDMGARVELGVYW
jgi:hypothetical protein